MLFEKGGFPPSVWAVSTAGAGAPLWREL